MSDSGVCEIKAEYILPDQERQIILECVSEKDKTKLQNEDEKSEEQPAKRQKLSKSEKKKLKGQNKSRGPTFVRNKEVELCNCYSDIAVDEEAPKCERKNCQFLHSVEEYLKVKLDDIASTCYNFETTGRCIRGLTCRFGSVHISSDGKNVVDNEKVELHKEKGLKTKNQLSYDLQISLRKRQYNFDLSEALIRNNDKRRAEKSGNPKAEPKKTSGSVTDEDVVKILSREKKKIDWTDKLVLSPLTTVGNLPFRRICKEYGADVTCGEMAMCTSLLQGAPQEWALVKRHHTEDIFGVQLCGNNPYVLTKCCQLLEKECEIDFVDLNLGCPIELVYREGGGCGLVRRQNVLECCVRSMSDALTIPLTVKNRTGVYSNESIAHLLAPKFRDWGATLMTIHGRSREQRYTRSADWSYIREVAKAAAPMPVLGNGDILTYDDYKKARETAPELTGVMIGRGALIKPWIFREIKEQKLIDVSSRERFDLIQKYVNYGLEHWGSDNKGVENTRRFLLEWLSFLYRYVPVGLLERPPQKINDRPPYYRGRDDLETLMASPSAGDWIKLSEMFLGKVPENFVFLPKHKANSYK
ncbi:unnamed protein product [Brassicogethes aeneus]|uniref:tRNA-dihydrouridine(47) synthase [NAD(P)(+)] n=1 Tax=Brassicogethes aeneus TaxID=1431903 RepID=A0A9P0B6A2_BRAAE|nr:unnamed protein product [Brassicogethes aeneus]